MESYCVVAMFSDSDGVRNIYRIVVFIINFFGDCDRIFEILM